jgi:hypothetical protein
MSLLFHYVGPIIVKSIAAAMKLGGGEPELGSLAAVRKLWLATHPSK